MPIVVSIFQPPASYEAQPPASYEAQTSNDDSPPSKQVESRCKKPYQHFAASNGWFLNFCHRKRFSSRRITTSGRAMQKKEP